jgi:hypothetical protein
MDASVLLDHGSTDGISVGLGYSFPLLLQVNMKFSTPDPKNGATSFKS